MIITDYKPFKRKDKIMMDCETNTPDWFVWNYVELLRFRKVPFKGMIMRNNELKSTVVHIFMEYEYVQFYMCAGSNMLHVKKHKITTEKKIRYTQNHDFLMRDESLLNDVECTEMDIKDKYYYFADPYVYMSNTGKNYCPTLR